ncbi:MAG: hypothetical protein HPY75_14060, partial [Actinobacteria bacterium]|nr:hypothetical protein [Actinomycetota bacterium]
MCPGKSSEPVKECSYAGEAESAEVIRRSYDRLGNNTSETVCDGTGDGAHVYSHKCFSYNALSKVERIYAAIGEEGNGFSLGTWSDVPSLALSEISSYTYFSDGLVSGEIRNNNNPEGRSPVQRVAYSYDPLEKKILERWEAGGETQLVRAFQYDGAGNLLAEALGDGASMRATSYAYDAAGRIKKKILPQAHAGESEGERSYTYSYSDPEHKVSIADPEGRVVVNTLDDLGRVEISEVPGEEGSYSLRAYDHTGTVIRESARKERKEGADSFSEAFFRYDDRGRLAEKRVLSEEEEQPAILSTTFSYDHGGNLVSTTTPAGNTTFYRYDTLSRLRRQELPHEGTDKIVTSYAYDVLGRKTHVYEGDTNPGGTRYTYDGLSHLRMVEQWTENWRKTGPNNYAEPSTGEKAVTSYDVDLSGNLVSQTNARGHTTTYAYDPCGRVVAKTDPLGRLESFTYTPCGEVDAHTYLAPDPDHTIDYDYDGRGRLQRERAVEGASVTDVITYEYDHADNMTKAVNTVAGGVDIPDRSLILSYDASSRLKAAAYDDEGTVHDYATAYSYHDSGEMASRTLTSGGQVQAISNYTYDISGRLTGVSDSLCGGTLAFRWDPDSRLERVSLPSGGHIDYTYYADGLTRTQRAYSEENELKASYAYAYDGRGKRSAMSVDIPSDQGISGNYSYAYDGMGRISSFDPPDALGPATTYAYDLAGNLKEVKEDGAVAKQYAYDAADQIESGPEGTYAYDGRGNLVRKGEETFSWDGLGRLSSYKKSAGDPELSFSYDPLGRLSERKAGGESLCFRYDGTSLSQAQETDGQGGIIATYAIDPSGTHLAQERQGTLSYLGLSPHTDVTFALSPEGSLSGARAYSPYGELLTDNLSSSLSYQEDYSDPASGLSWMGARWYSPALARLISRDPLKGEMEDPLSSNPYLYCADDPINAFDPSGRLGTDVFERVGLLHVSFMPEALESARHLLAEGRIKDFLAYVESYDRRRTRSFYAQMEAEQRARRSTIPGPGNANAARKPSAVTPEDLADMVNLNNGFLQSLGIPPSLLPEVTPAQMAPVLSAIGEAYDMEHLTIPDLFSIGEAENALSVVEKTLESLQRELVAAQEAGLG